MEQATPAVEVRDLWMTFPAKRAGEQIRVLEHVNLTVRQGEFVCIVGPSGCGKSTLLNVIGGFLRATAGEALVEGRPVDGPDPRRIFVFQENGVFPWMSVRENVGVGLARKPAAERDAAFAELRRFYSEPEIVELGLYVGYFIGFGRMVAAWDMSEQLPESMRDTSRPAVPWGAETFVVPNS